MDSITVKNYRCFGTEQTARLAPLTLLVGENSSGKTALAAMIRALWDVAYAERVPDFKEAPYDLGSFDEIVHHRGARGGRAEKFDAGFEFFDHSEDDSAPYKVEVTFGPKWGAPVPIRKRISRNAHWIELSIDDEGRLDIHFGTPRGTWRHDDPRTNMLLGRNGGADTLLALNVLWFVFLEERPLLVEQVDGALDITDEDKEQLRRVLLESPIMSLFDSGSDPSRRPFASAPTRSHPRRTYDPASVVSDAEGDYVPMYLAQLSLRDPGAWSQLKSRLEDFGQMAGLFDEIRVRHLGKTAVDPFQIQVRRFGKPLKGPLRNLADVGYGVSQVLPLIAELLRDDGPRMMLLQQPEIHLHPSAESALGSLLCSIVAAEKRRDRQLIVETHSDFIIDRLCMAVRDQILGLKPEDVSIVYFERCGLEVHLHSIDLDDLGNLQNPPTGYRQFFIDESVRFLGA